MTMKKMMLMLLPPLLILSASGCENSKTGPEKRNTALTTAQDDLPPKRVTPPSPRATEQRASRSRRLTTHKHPDRLRSQSVTESSQQKLTQGSVWDRLALCEAGGNWSTNTGNGYYGGLQFSLSSWRAVGGSGLPSNASRSEQIRRGELLRAQQGWGAWPSCSRKLGLR